MQECGRIMRAYHAKTHRAHGAGEVNGPMPSDRVCNRCYDNPGIIVVRHQGDTFRACAKCYRLWRTSMELAGLR